MAIRTHIGKQEEAQEERPIQLRPADPASPSLDQLWLNTTEKRVKFYDGASIQPTVSSVPNEPVSTKTANYLLQPSDGIILGDATTGAIILTLPAAALNAGKKYILNKIDSTVNTVTIDPNAAELIDGRATLTIDKEFQSIHIISDGVGWKVISSNIARYGKHVLSAAVTVNGAIAALTFNNLVVGKSYRVHGAMSFKSVGTSAAEFRVEVKEGVNIIATLPYSSDLGVTATSIGSFDTVFTASAITATFEVVAIAAGHSIEGLLADSKTYAILEENNMYQQTNEWD